jgi:DNA gyrase subunit A
LFRFTQLQTNFGIQLLCVDQGRPKTMNLKEILDGFINFRKEVVIRRTRFELAKAKEREHILDGLKIALDNLDEVIRTIRQAENPTSARESLMENFALSQIQAQAILEMRLQRLTGLERDKILQELKEIQAKIAELQGILASDEKILTIIVEELQQVKEQYADPRRTEILDAETDVLDEDLIPREDMVVTFSSKGYVKRVQASLYKTQRPGGKGRIGTRVGSEDVVNQMLYASSHDVLLCFSSRGRVYWLRVFQVPEEGPYARGKAIINLLKIEPDEKIRKILPVQELSTEGYVVMVSAQGKTKKTSISEFSRPRSTGLIALTIDPEDELIDVNFASGDDQILLATRKGKAIRFHETQVRPMGRQARGVNGISLKPGDAVIGMEVISNDNGSLLTVTQSGFGKRTAVNEYPVQNRGGQGVITIKNAARSGDAVRIQLVDDTDHLLILTSGGRIIRLRMDEINVIGRNTMGRTLVRMDEGEHVVDVARAEPSEDDAQDEEQPADEELEVTDSPDMAADHDGPEED